MTKKKPQVVQNIVIPYILIVLTVIGFIDALYLTQIHLAGFLPPCHTTAFQFINAFIDCSKVLTSKYAEIVGIPLAAFGVLHYTALLVFFVLTRITKSVVAKILFILETAVGFVSSLYFVYLMVGVIGKICTYCTVSAFVSFVIFFIAIVAYREYWNLASIFVLTFAYRCIGKKILFRIDPETVHESMTSIGQIFGVVTPVRSILSYFFEHEEDSLHQNIAGIYFRNPIGLAAGFDYDAKLTQVLSSLNFGFQTIGTITNIPYEGNSKPRLGRLPESRSLMVNKGFKNFGASQISQSLSNKHMRIPVGVSIGRSNSELLTTQKKSIEDICKSFGIFENSKVHHSHYELNISCPNLKGKISFYEPRFLEDLLKAVDSLHISRPIFIKMPIELSDSQVLKMLSVIVKFNIQGVIFGNLQKNRSDASLDPREVSKFSAGYFSGKPTEKRSNELISLAYRHYANRLTIVGCGGVFDASDAYTKICLGASLVELITGMIFNGPQLVSDITRTLPELLKRDGFSTISEAVGSAHVRAKLS